MALDPDVRELFEKPNYAHLATLLPDGSPHAVAVWSGFVDGDRLGFFTQPASRKARNVAADPRVCLSVVDRDNPYRMASVRGRVVDTIEGEAALEWMDRRAVAFTGRPFPMRSGTLYVVEPQKVWKMTLPFEDAPRP
ncbi:MAG TPA: TIGR03618 family F420-dependent PPOX class oxidoreductase [Solirubrobacteraceae bacterium]|nr:TIGR03618 family F420-dependent PPOX class oxidoreductase [Solirubrobacteraceae bacterium]